MKEAIDPLADPTIAAGLKWLALHQAPDGHWSLHEFNRHARAQPLPAGRSFVCNCTGTSLRKDDVAATSFALLPFLGAGITSKKPEKDAPVDYSKTVQAGLRFLLAKQAKDGSFSIVSYSHALATMAVCNAYALTGDAALKGPSQRAINFIIAFQDPVGGGWRYGPRMPGDCSVTGWELQALKSGQLAGLKVPAGCLQMADKFLDSVETTNKGCYSYVPGSPESISMTAAGLLGRLYLGVDPRNKGLLAGIDRLKASPPGSTKNLYFEYYATQVMFHVGGENGALWLKGTDEKPGMLPLLAKQADAGLNPKSDHQKGSWAPGDAGQVREGGRIMATALSLLFRRDKEKE
jgi:hypothetical protein